MSDNTIYPEQQNRDRNRKRKALLAGGLVLGIGAAATLAAFTDGEFAKGTFSTGSFGIEGSPTSSDDGFSEHASEAGAATLSFTTSASNMTPGDSIYSSYYIRTIEDSLGGTLSDGTATKSGTNEQLEALLTPGVKYIAAGATCDATTYANGATSPDTLEGDSGNVVQACINVTLEDDQSAVQGAGANDATIVWSWTATSA